MSDGYSSCVDCDGRGIKIGPYDPNTGENEIRECGKCYGYGIKITLGDKKVPVAMAGSFYKP